MKLSICPINLVAPYSLKHFIDSGWELNELAGYRDPENNTLLHLATQVGNHKLVYELINSPVFHAQLLEKNNHGDIPALSAKPRPWNHKGLDSLLTQTLSTLKDQANYLLNLAEEQTAALNAHCRGAQVETDAKWKAFSARFIALNSEHNSRVTQLRNSIADQNAVRDSLRALKVMQHPIPKIAAVCCFFATAHITWSLFQANAVSCHSNTPENPPLSTMQHATTQAGVQATASFTAMNQF